MLVLFMTSLHLLLIYNFYLFMWWVVNVSFGVVVTVSIMCTFIILCLLSSWCIFLPLIGWIIGVFPFIWSLPTVQYMSMTSALYLTIFQMVIWAFKADRFVPMLMLVKSGIKMYYESWVLVCSKVFEISSQFIFLHVLQILIPYSCQSSFLKLLS
jgi:hypothetical protein